MMLSLLSIVIATVSLSAASRLDEIKAYNRLYQLFESLFGIRDIAYTSAVCGNSPRELLELIQQSGATEAAGFKIELKHQEDNPQLAYSTIDIDLPANYNMGKSGYYPDKMQIKLNQEELVIDYVFLTKGKPNTLVNQFAKECLLAQADDVSENGVKKFSFYGSHEYVVKAISEKEVSFAYVKELRNDFWYSIPAGYFPELRWTQLPDLGPYNTGKEPFKTFLRKFNTNKTFRAKRVKWSTLSTYEERMKNIRVSLYGFNKLVLQALPMCQLLPLKGQAIYSAKKKEHDVVGQWVFPTANKIIYSGWNDRKVDEFDTNGIMLLFERIDGLWYCTATSYFGSKMSAAVSKVMEEDMGN